jgi:hypothetical protein
MSAKSTGWEKIRNDPKYWCYNSKCHYYRKTKYGKCSSFPFPFHIDNCDNFMSLNKKKIK